MEIDLESFARSAAEIRLEADDSRPQGAAPTDAEVQEVLHQLWALLAAPCTSCSVRLAEVT